VGKEAENILGGSGRSQRRCKAARCSEPQAMLQAMLQARAPEEDVLGRLTGALI
jgi:hypothetical protein